MTVSLPQPSQIKEIGDQLGIDLDDSDLLSFQELFKQFLSSYKIIDQMPDYLPIVKYARTPGYKPRAEENKFNAWYIKTEVKSNSTGKLKGRSVVLKDNIMLAGVPMMNGSSTLEEYIPGVDATVITRLLDAEATIVGKRPKVSIFVYREVVIQAPPELFTIHIR